MPRLATPEDFQTVANMRRTPMMTDAERLETYADDEVLAKELERYGLPKLPLPHTTDFHSPHAYQREQDGAYLRVLLRHIYNNRDMVYATKDSLIKSLIDGEKP